MNRYILGDLAGHSDQQIYDHYVSYGSNWKRYYKKNWTKTFKGGKKKIFVYGGSPYTSLGDVHHNGGTWWNMCYLGEYLCWRDLMMDLKGRCLRGELGCDPARIMDLKREYCGGMPWEDCSLRRHFKNMIDGGMKDNFVFICHRKDPFVDMMMRFHLRHSILYRFDNGKSFEAPKGFEHLKMRQWWEE